ncbi:cation:proton antiporter [Streptococcaceae bacterium ESL0729]|nr:cation:proton antiporter [Streptococcaceae bacterium ESL0729]
MSLLLQVLIILSSLFLASLLAQRLGIPVVVGQLLMALIIGPVLGLIKEGEVLDFLAEIGVIFLMFLAGFEANLTLLKKYIRPSILVAILGVIFPVIIFSGYGAGLLGLNAQKSLFLGLIFAATSVSITIEVLQEYKKMHTRFAAIILGAAILDDILAVLSLSLLSPGNQINLYQQMLGPLLFVALLYPLATYLLPLIFKLGQNKQFFAGDLTLSLITCLALAALAQTLGMSDVLGAFFAGLILGQKRDLFYSDAHLVESQMASMAQSFFIPIFLSSIATPLIFAGLGQKIMAILILTGLALVSKILPAYVAARSFRITRVESLIIGTGMVSRGEMALIIAKIGLTNGLLAASFYSQVVLVIIATTILAPLMLRLLFKFSRAGA